MGRNRKKPVEEEVAVEPEVESLPEGDTQPSQDDDVTGDGVYEETPVKEEVVVEPTTLEVTEEVEAEETPVEVVKPDLKVLARAGLKKAFRGLSEGFEKGTASMGAQKALFNSIKRALIHVPSEVPDMLLVLAKECPKVIDKSSLRFDYLWKNYDERNGYTVMISLLMVRNNVIAKHEANSGSLKTLLKVYGPNGYYLATLAKK